MLIFKKILQYKFLFIAVFVYITVVGTVSILRHYQFQTQAWDMGIFEQTMWNTVNGRVMQNSLEEVSNHLGVHMSPFLFLLVPFYIFFQSPYFLIIIQTLALGLGAFPLYFFAKEKLNSPRLAQAIALSYLLHPSLHSINLFDFHPVAFFIPFIFLAFYFVERKNYFWVWVFILLAASTKEDSALICVSIVLFWMLQAIFKIENKRIKIKKINKKAKTTICLFIFLLTYFVVSTKFIMPALGGGLLRLDRYEHLGVNPALLFSTIFTLAKIKYVLFLILPVILLPLLSLSSIFLVLPAILENILTNYSPQFSGLYQYDAVVLPGLYISAVYGLIFLIKKITSVSLNRKKEYIFFSIIISFSFFSYLFSSQLGIKKFPLYLFKKNLQADSYRKVVKMIPDKLSLSAPTNLIPHLSHREYINLIGYEEFNTDIVLIDRFDKFGFESDEQFQQYFDKLVDSNEYRMTIVDDRYIFLVKSNP